MSFGISEGEKDYEIEISIRSKLELIDAMDRINSFSAFLHKKKETDIYTGNEDIPFEKNILFLKH